MSTYELAGQGDILLATRKDDFFTETLRQETRSVITTLLGTRQVSQLGWLVDAVTELVFGVLNFVSNFQSLGEEYASIVQVSVGSGTVTTAFQRSLYVLFAYILPILFRNGTTILHHLSRTPFTKATLVATLATVILRRVHSIQPFVLHASEFLSRAHIAEFYRHGIFHAISNRILKIRHVVMSDAPRPPGAPRFTLLGLMIWTQLAAQGYSSLSSLTSMLSKEQDKHEEAPAIDQDAEQVIPMQSGTQITEASEQQDVNAINNENDDDDDDDGVDKTQCALCLDFVQAPTLTSCGHVFCWECVTEWCATKPECPVCRQDIALQKLVILQHWC